MIVINPKNCIELTLQLDGSMQIRETKPDGITGFISIAQEDVLKFRDCLIKLLETYNG